MRYAPISLALSLTLICSACAAPPSLMYGSRSGLWAGPGYSSFRGAGPFWHRDLGLWSPGYAHDLVRRPDRVCDSFGRCWRRGPDGRADRGDDDGPRTRPEAPPPGWAKALPEDAREDRFIQQRPQVVCDQATRVCYKRGKIDRSNTEAVFGERARSRADAVREQLGTARLFLPQRGVACDRERRMCFDDGAPDRGLTRRYFGRRAARALD